MTLAILNLNDAGIQVAIDGELTRVSPGYAVLDDNRLLTGEAASQQARLLPSWTNNRFWSDLSTSPLPNRTDQVRHHADLAFAHLEDLWLPIKSRVKEVIFCVPGYYTSAHLGLLLGMARECDMPVVGVVDHAVAAASNQPLAPIVLHLDIHLHRITLTRMNMGQSSGGSSTDPSGSRILARKEVNTVVETGLATLWDRWANVIAGQFIQTTRFDPMHEAATEQQLFNKLPAWIAGLDPRGANHFQLDVGTDAGKHSVTLASEHLLTACTPLYPQIVQAIRQALPDGATASLLLSHHFNGFPGIHDSLSLINNLHIVELTPSEPLAAAHEHRHQITNTGGRINHVLQLDVNKDCTDKHPRPAPDPVLPTHLLWQHQALPIGRSFKLDRDLAAGPKQQPDNPVCTLYPRHDQLLMECHDTDAIRINDKVPDPLMPLQVGDRISATGDGADKAIALIRVQSHG